MARRRSSHTAALHELANLIQEKHTPVRAACRAVVEKYPDEHPDALRQHWIRHGGVIPKTHENQLLTDEQEAVVVATLRAFSLYNRGLKRTVVLDFVREYASLAADWNGIYWYESFMSRHADLLRPRHTTPLCFKRVAPELYKQVQAWIRTAEQVEAEHHYSPETIYNADETLISIKNVKHSGLTVEVVEKKNHNEVGTKRLTYGSMISFSNAAGWTPLIVVILPADFREADDKTAEFFLPGERDKASDHTAVMYAFTKKGYMDNALFVSVMAKFRAIIKARHPDLDHLLFMDRLQAHLQPAVVAACLADRLYTVWFPPHCSEFLQPADQQQFAVFHNQMNLLVTHYDRTALLRHAGGRALVMQFFKRAQEACTQQDVVKISFETAGIWPWDPDKILQNARRVLKPKLAAKDLHPVPKEIEKAERAIMNILEANQQPTPAKRLRAGIRRGEIYTADDLIRADQIGKEEKARLQAEKEERARTRQEEKVRKLSDKANAKRTREELRQQKRAAKDSADRERRESRARLSCRSCGRQCKNPSSPLWLWCDYCDDYGVCTRCPGSDAAMQQHEDEERQKKKPRLEKPEPSSADAESSASD